MWKRGLVRAAFPVIYVSEAWGDDHYEAVSKRRVAVVAWPELDNGMSVQAGLLAIDLGIKAVQQKPKPAFGGFSGSEWRVGCDFRRFIVVSAKCFARGDGMRLVRPRRPVAD